MPRDAKRGATARLTTKLTMPRRPGRKARAPDAEMLGQDSVDDQRGRAQRGGSDVPATIAEIGGQWLRDDQPQRALRHPTRPSCDGGKRHHRGVACGGGGMTWAGWRRAEGMPTA